MVNPQQLVGLQAGVPGGRTATPQRSGQGAVQVIISIDES
jgi:hypothetical protein